MRTGSQQEYSGGQFPFSEVLCTYLLHLHHLSMRFMKELHDAYNRAPLSGKIFALPGEKRGHKILEHLEKLLHETLLTTVGNKENIYAAANVKRMMLNFQ